MILFLKGELRLKENMIKGMKMMKEEKEEELGARGEWSHKLYNWEQLAVS